MKSNSSISVIVMRRVRRMRMLRAVISVPVLSMLTLFVSLWGIGREVWVAKVLANMPSVYDAPAVARFFSDAFLHTDFVVQAASVIAIAALVWLAHGFATMRRSSSHFA